MSATTLLVVNGATLADGMAELLRVADAYSDAQAVGAGVAVERHPGGWVTAVEADYDVPAGVIETYTMQTGEHLAWPDDPWLDVRQLLEVVHARTDGDVVATPGGVAWL